MENYINDEKHYRTRDAAKYIGLSASTLAKKRMDGSGPTFIKLGKKLVTYRKSDLDLWCNANSFKNTGEY